MKSVGGDSLVLLLSACVAAGCLVPPLRVSPDGGGDTPGRAGGAPGGGGSGAVATSTGGNGAGAATTSIDADGGCPGEPAPMLTVKFDFAKNNMGVTTDSGDGAWTADEGCPSPGAVEATFTFGSSAGDQQVLIGTILNPGLSLTGQVLYARVKVLSGAPGPIQLVAKTGKCSIYSDGEPLAVAAGEGWKVVSLDAKAPFYYVPDCQDSDCQNVVDCSMPGSIGWDPGQVTEVDVQVNPPQPFDPNPITVVIDTIEYGH